MNLRIICQIAKADLRERTRRFSFPAICAFSLLLAFFSLPDVDAPLVSVCLEPNRFNQGSNPSWISITIALCGGILFPLIGLSFVKNNINMDRSSGWLYGMQAMNLKKSRYIAGKFLANLSLLTVMWSLVIIGAALMLPFQFPRQPLPVYDFISPFLGSYPGLVFTAALAVLLESIPFVSRKAGNALGLTVLFVIFLINYSASAHPHPLLRVFDFSNYRWLMDSINGAVIPAIGREVQETGILVPGGMFAGSQGRQELFFHGLLWNGRHFTDKILLILVSVCLVLLAGIWLETTEQRNKLSSGARRKKEIAGRKTNCCTKQMIAEFRMILKDFPKSCLVLDAGLWLSCIWVPLKYVQGYLWIILLLFSVTLFSQMGCREHENGLTAYFLTIRFALIRQLLYSYLWGTVILLILAAPVGIRCFMAANYSNGVSYVVFAFFIPALAGFLGEYTRSRRAFETAYLLLCFLLLNMPAFLFQGYVMAVMAAGAVVLPPVTLLKRLAAGNDITYMSAK